MKQVLLWVITASCICQAFGQDAQLVKDINMADGSADPKSFIYVNGYAFFIADDGVHGKELWKSDGTAEGTILVKDINPGLTGSFANETAVKGMAPVGNKLFFTADDGTHGQELWVTDGTTAGTVMVKDIYSGSSGSYPDQFAILGNTLFFSANNGSEGIELWKSDGTAAGTMMVADINPDSNDSNPTHLVALHDTVYFSAKAGEAEGYELWKSDGTTSGTILIKDINASGSSSPEQLIAVGDTLFFIAEDGIHGHELWKSDGTAAGTILVKDIYSGSLPDIKPQHLTRWADTLYFTATDTDNNVELWKSDGTAEGTALVKNIHSTGSSNPGSLTIVDNTLYFDANDGIHGIELWKSDGTEAGTALLQDINTDGSSNPAELINIAGVLFFTAEISDTVRGLWKIDTSTGAAVLVADIFEHGFSPLYLTNIGGMLFYRAGDVIYGNELWKSDGTEAGTVMVKNINEAGMSGNPAYSTKVDHLIFFLQETQSSKNLWCTDGTETRTQLLKDQLNVWTGNSSIHKMVSFNGALYFTATDYVYGYELWKSDGTAEGTILVKDIYSGLNGSYPKELTVWRNMLFFIADDGTGPKLWKSDGTEAGTVLVQNIATVSPNPQLVTSPQYLYFTFNDGINGTELWKSDGTETGTQLVKDIYPGANSSSPTHFAVYGNKLYFNANDGMHGRELWVSDGTEAGTTMVKASFVGTDPQDLTVAGNTLFFSADNGLNGRELWKTNGTEVGTHMVMDIMPGNNTSDPVHLFNFRDTLYFVADDGTHGKELWRSDGTAAGTMMVADINPDSEDSSPKDLITVKGKLYFTAYDGIHGEELWVTHGTADSTKIVADIFAGASGSNPDDKVVIGDTILFSATTQLGRELWKYVIYNIPPTAHDHTVTIQEDSLFTLDIAMLSFADNDPEDSLQTMIITSVPEAGILFLDKNSNHTADDDEKIFANDEIETVHISNITFIPDTNAFGDDYTTFSFKVSDGKDYSHNAYQIRVHVTPVADAPQIANTLATYGSFTTAGLEITPNAADGAEITHYKISGIVNGTLYLHNSTTQVHEGNYITVGDAASGLKFWPDAAGTGSFEVQAAIGDTETGLSKDKTTAIITINKAPQIITFDLLSDKSFGDAPFELTASASSDLPVSFNVTGPATLDENQLTITGTGIIMVEATQKGNQNYKNAPSVVREFEVKKAEQSISMLPLPDKTYGDAPFALTATASSGLKVSYSVTGPAKIRGNLLTMTGSGTVSVLAYQSGDANYQSAPSMTITFEVHKAQQNITFDPIADQLVNASVKLTATASSGLPVTYEVAGPAQLNSGNKLKLKEAGAVTIKAIQPGDQNYLPADTVVISFNVKQLAQTITFPPLPEVAVHDTIILAASASSGLEVTFKVEGPAELKGNQLIITGEGAIKVTALQAGDNKYATAEEVTQTLQVLVTGIRKKEAAVSIQVYPNPVMHEVIMNTADHTYINSRIMIINMIGNTIQQTTLDSDTMKLDMTNAKPGIYFVIIENAFSKQIFKLIKQ